MKLAALFSGGKDSSFAAWISDVVCLITVRPGNKESYLYHTPNLDLTRLMARAANLPLLEAESSGEKEAEVSDLKRAIADAKGKYGIEGIVTGAIESVYQAERVERVCHELGLWCFHPLWKKNQEQHLKDVAEHFDVIISAVAAYPLDQSFLGLHINDETIAQLKKTGVSLAGEGGEMETTVLDAPFFKQKIEIIDSEIVQTAENAATLVIKDARLVPK